MNLERWLKIRRPAWQELETLLRQVDRAGLKSLKSPQLKELGRLYRATSADLCRARAMRAGQELEQFLNNIVIKAHNQVYQTKSSRLKDFLIYLGFGFPALVRKNILYVTASFLVFLTPGLIGWFFTEKDLHFADLEVMEGVPIVPERVWYKVQQHQMWTDSAQEACPEVASEIATNNIRVSIYAYAMGITFGIGTAYILFVNGLMLGTIFSVCHQYAIAHRLLAFIAPHGVLELTAIFISGGAGLMMGFAMLFPGQYSRVDALKLVAKEAAAMFGGCVLLLIIAGTIEGFISPRTDLKPEAKFAVSLATLICLTLYLFGTAGLRRTAQTEKLQIQ